MVNVGSRPVSASGSRRGSSASRIEYPSSIGYSGRDPARLNPVFLRLVRSLNPGQSPVHPLRRRHGGLDLVAGARAGQAAAGSVTH